MVSAVSDVRHSTTSTTRPATTWMRCASVPRTRAPSRCHPPMRRSSSTRADAHSTAMASAATAAPQRPASPSSSERCRFFTQRGSTDACHAPSTWPVAGSMYEACGWSPAKLNTTTAPEGRRRISSAAGTVRVTRSTSVATVRSLAAAGACQACCTGSMASSAPVMPSTTATVPSVRPSQRWTAFQLMPVPFTEVAASLTGCTACPPAACQHWQRTAARALQPGCRACLPPQRQCGFRSPRQSAHRPGRR